MHTIIRFYKKNTTTLQNIYNTNFLLTMDVRYYSLLMQFTFTFRVSEG